MIHITNIISSSYDPTTGVVTVKTKNTQVNGLSNTVFQYQTPQTISLVKPGCLAHLTEQNTLQTQINGYASILKDTNFNLVQGEFASFSDNWYSSTRISGVEIQQAQTTNKENAVMGQSTNMVLSDILGIIIGLITAFNTHTHSGVETGGGISGITTVFAPSDSGIIADKTYIDANKNLAITGIYQPK